MKNILVENLKELEKVNKRRNELLQLMQSKFLTIAENDDGYYKYLCPNCLKQYNKEKEEGYCKHCGQIIRD